MNQIKNFINIDESTTLEDFLLVAGTTANNFKTNNQSYSCKVYTFLTTSERVVITYDDASKTSLGLDTNVFAVDNMKHYPLNYKNMDIVNMFEIVIAPDSQIASHAEAVDMVAAIMDIRWNSTDNKNDRLQVVKLVDRKFGIKTNYIVPTIFATGAYVTRSNFVKVGDVAAGKTLLTSYGWSLDSVSTLNGDGIAI